MNGPLTTHPAPARYTYRIYGNESSGADYTIIDIHLTFKGLVLLGCYLARLAKVGQLPPQCNAWLGVGVSLPAVPPFAISFDYRSTDTLI
ncbi:hypothetical protein E2C01_004174 [Portunus trituberculatus]|uniref:Uncharacterized protein n=1 Tax=Portunus trituberculatus TaxID=210409 RepID=A0A5B7CP66_PORTR|nr:hypothetical protein [Portunus trituberculatus]